MLGTGGSVSPPPSRSLVLSSHKLWMALQAGSCSEILPESGLKKQCPVFTSAGVWTPTAALQQKKTVQAMEMVEQVLAAQLNRKAHLNPFKALFQIAQV